MVTINIRAFIVSRKLLLFDVNFGLDFGVIRPNTFEDNVEVGYAVADTYISKSGQSWIERASKSPNGQQSVWLLQSLLGVILWVLMQNKSALGHTISA